MIKLENTEVVGWEHAIRGMRNPKNSWEKSDSGYCTNSCDDCDNFSICNPNFEPYFRRFWVGGPVDCGFAIGPNDHDLMMRLANGGPVHAKYRRMIVVYVDITAPFYFWKEFSTYKVGTVANSCSTMHKIADKEFTLEDFSCEHLLQPAIDALQTTINELNQCRDLYLGFDGFKYKYGEQDKKDYWYQMIQLLPSSYNQKRTIMLNYEVLAGMYQSRRNHKLDEWRDLCAWIDSLPYSEIICGREVGKDSEDVVKEEK